MRKRRAKKKRDKKMMNLNTYDIWHNEVPDPRSVDYNSPDFTVVAISSLLAAKAASRYGGISNIKKFQGIQTNSSDANYVVRPSEMKSPRYLTFWK